MRAQYKTNGRANIKVYERNSLYSSYVHSATVFLIIIMFVVRAMPAAVFI